MRIQNKQLIVTNAWTIGAKSFCKHTKTAPIDHKQEDYFLFDVL